MVTLQPPHLTEDPPTVCRVFIWEAEDLNSVSSWSLGAETHASYLPAFV